MELALAIVLGYLVILAGGDCLAALIGGADRERGVAERAALAFALGVGAVALCLFWASLLAPGRVGAWAAVVPALGLAAWRALARRRSPPTPARGTPRRAVAVLVVLLLLTQSMAAALATGLGWDGMAVWGLKSRAAFLSGGVPIDYLTDRSRQWSQLAYPWLVPLGETWFYLVVGRVDEVVAKALFPGFYASLLLLFYAQLRQGCSLPLAALFTAALGLGADLYGWAHSGYADVPVTLFWFGSVAYTLRWVRGGGRADLLLASLLAALAAWTKQEGSVYLVFQAAATLVLAAATRRPRELLWWALPPLIVLGPWLIVRSQHQLPDTVFFPMTPATFLTYADRVPTILAMTLRELGNVFHWGFLWCLFGAALLVPHPGSPALDRRYLAASVLVPPFVLDLGYVFSTWTPFTSHVAVSLNRLVLQQSAAAALFVALELRGDLEPLLDWTRRRARSAT